MVRWFWQRAILQASEVLEGLRTEIASAEAEALKSQKNAEAMNAKARNHGKLVLLLPSLYVQAVRHSKISTYQEKSSNFLGNAVH